MAQHTEIRMAGTGGQGLIFVASFLAECAIAQDLNVVQTQTYGIAQRGGFISAEAIISPDEILFQQVTSPNVIVALHDVVGSRYDEVDVPVVYDTSIMAERSFANWLGIPCTKTAQDMGAPKSANLVALGAAYHIHPFVDFDSIVKAAEKKFAPKIAEMNIEAVKKGIALAEAASQTR
jgi:2-oxoglutarate ferredoxin oxidoreductase subunit gamma